MLAKQYIYFVCFIGFCAASSTCQSVEQLKDLDAVLKNKQKYDYRLRPTTGNDENLRVLVTLSVYNLWDLNQRSMDCKIDFELDLTWIDTRFNLSHQVYVQITNTKDLNKFWTPKVTFPNSKKIEYHKHTSSNYYLDVDFGGYMSQHFRASATFICNMRFHDFPFDEHRCFFQLSTYSTHVKMEWEEYSFQEGALNENDIELPQFELINQTTTSACEGKYQNNSSDCLQVNYYFRRRLGFHLINTYIPSFLIVVISWGSFWMHPEAVPGRVSLGITTLLTMSSKSSAVLSLTAEVSYVKAIDIWMMMCMALVFLSLLEFVIANYKIRHKPKKKTKGETNHVDGYAGKNSIRSIKRVKEWSIDRLSRILFPFIFFIFNIVYWSYYLS